MTDLAAGGLGKMDLHVYTEAEIKTYVNGAVEAITEVVNLGRVPDGHVNSVRQWLFNFWPSYLPWNQAGLQLVIPELLKQEQLLKSFMEITGHDLADDLANGLVEEE